MKEINIERNLFSFEFYWPKESPKTIPRETPRTKKVEVNVIAFLLNFSESVSPMFSQITS